MPWEGGEVTGDQRELAMRDLFEAGWNKFHEKWVPVADVTQLVTGAQNKVSDYWNGMEELRDRKNLKTSVVTSLYMMAGGWLGSDRWQSWCGWQKSWAFLLQRTSRFIPTCNCRSHE